MDTAKPISPDTIWEASSTYHMGNVIFLVKPKDSSRKIQGEKWFHIKAAESLGQGSWQKEKLLVSLERDFILSF